jgi:hypothetical protein
MVVQSPFQENFRLWPAGEAASAAFILFDDQPWTVDSSSRLAAAVSAHQQLWFGRAS